MLAPVFDTRSIRIGELLVESGLVALEDVTEAAQVSKRLQIPVGRVMIVSGCVTENLLEAALQAQILIQEGLVEIDTACEALKIVRDEGVPLQNVLVATDEIAGRPSESDIASLLLDSEIVSREQMDLALEASAVGGVPLGSALVLQGILSPNLFPSVTQIQAHLRDGKLNKEEAIEQLKHAFVMWLKAEESLRIREAQLEEASNSLRKNPDVLRLPTAEIPTEEEPVDVPRIVELLKEAGIVRQHDIQRAYESMLGDPASSAKMFLALGLIDEATYKAVRRCHSLMRKKLISSEQAVRILRSCRSGMSTLDDALVEHTEEALPYFKKEWRRSTLVKMATVAASACLFTFLRSKS